MSAGDWVKSLMKRSPTVWPSGNTIAEAKTVAVGFDAKSLHQVWRKLLLGASVMVVLMFLILVAGTEEVYAAVSALKLDAGIEVTASHNPIEYNGMKIVKQSSNLYLIKDF